MRLQRINDLNALSDNDYINWKRQAIHNGWITNDTSFDQMNRLYSMQQLQNAGLDPNMSLDQANAILASGQLSQLLQDNQLGEEVAPLIGLYKSNPVLATQLANKLFDSGYMTLDEINKRAESPLSPYREGADWLAGAVSNIGQFFGFEEGKLGKDNKSLNYYDPHAFNTFYRQVKEEREKVRTKIGTEEEQEESIMQEARRRYLLAQNGNILDGIKSEIDNYYSAQAEAKAPEIEQRLNQLNPNQFTDMFESLANGGEEVVNTAGGDMTIQHPGSNYWRAYKDTNVFDNFGDTDKKQIMSRYLAYKELLGEDRANEYLETAMQTYVAQNRGWGKAIADVAGGVGTTAGLIIPEALVGVCGLAWDIIGAVLPEDYGGRWARNQASLTLTGRDLQGNQMEVPTWSESSDPLSWLGSRLNMGYLNKVSQYKNWDIEQIKKAEANGGVSKDAMYITDPTAGWQFKNDAIEMLDMTGQAIGQIALAYATSGASLGTKAVATMSRAAAAMRVGAEVATTTAPIASAYAVAAANEAYNNTVNTSNEMAYKDALHQFNLLSQTDEYKQQRKEAVDKFFNQKSKKGMDGIVYLAPFESEEYRRQQEDLYDHQQLMRIYNDLVAQRQKETSQLAQNSSLLAYRTSASLEALKYGYTTAMFGSWKLSGNANKLLEQNLGVKTYGKLTQDAAGKFSREGIHPLGIKKLILKSPNQIAAWRTAEAAVIGGGLSNYTDDVTTGFAVGLSLGYSNSSLLREYDPQAYADTWYGDSEAAQALHIMGSGIEGVADMIRSGQPWHSFYIGMGGSFLGAGFRFRGRNEVRQQYDQQNARYEAETGKKVSKFTKFRQGVNTYTQTLWSTYEDARMGVNRLDQNVKIYNEALDKRQDALNEIASMRQGIIKRKYAENEMSFSDAALESDNLALKLIAIQYSLQSNPLRQLDKQKLDTELLELQDIAEDNVSDEKRESLIQSAYGAREQDKSKPLTDQRKAEIWEDIKANAKRFTDFQSDYFEAIDQLKYEDRSLNNPMNWPLLHQKAELVAKSKRIQRDIDSLSKEVGISVDTSVSDRTQGELTETARQSSIKAARETLEALNKQRVEANDKIQELELLLDPTYEKYQQSKVQERQEQLLKQRALILRADRAIPRLEAEIKGLEEGTTMAQANSGLTNNVIQLNNMLSSSELYTTEQQDQINRYRAQIGEKGVLYVQEMAKMQDQLNEMNDAREALDANPETFQALVTGLQSIREFMGQRAIYNTRLQNQFNTLKGLAPEEIGSHSAMALTSEQFDQFVEENPELANTLAPYKEMNSSFSYLYSLTQKAVDTGAMDKQTQKDILMAMQSLALQDSDYILDNRKQAISDMLAFLEQSNQQNPAMTRALNTLITDFNRVASIEKSTVAYTEYKVRQLAESARELADSMVEQAERQQQHQVEQIQQQAQQEVTESPEIVPDMASMENETGEAIDLGDTEVEDTETSEEATPKSEEAPETPSQEETQPAAEQEGAQSELPSGVTRNSEGQIETMSIDQQAEQLGITAVSQETMVDDNAPIVQESTNQQDEVHGCYFNPYDGYHLNVGELVPFTEGPVYEWLANQGINLGAIIDDELHNILQVNPKIQLMKVKKEGNGAKVASNVFLVVEYTDKVAKQHLPENGGVITSNGKQYLIIGTMWNTKSQDNTEAASTMQATRTILQKRGVEFFDANPAESYYVDPVMNTEITTFYSGHIVHTIEGQESRPHTISELIDEYNRTHTAANQISMADLGFAAITMKEGFYPVGPVDIAESKKHKPQEFANPDKYGQVYVLVKAANGETVPIFINPTLVSEINEDSALSKQIDTCINGLMSENYAERESAICDLCQLLCISGSITNPDSKGILIGTADIPTVTLVNGNSKILPTFNMKNHTVNGRPFSFIEFRNAIRQQLNPRINLSLSNLAQESWIKRYDEAGALTTDATKLGTYGGKYYVASIDSSTGQPIKVTPRVTISENTSDYSRAQAGPTMLHVSGKRYVFRDGKWKHQDGTAVTERAEQVQVILAYKVQTGQASFVQREGPLDYYVMDVETSDPKVMGFNIITRKYEGVTPEKASEIVAIRRAEIEKARANAEAQKVLKETPITTEQVETETVTEPTQEETSPEASEKTQPEETVEPVTEAPQRNDFELESTGTRERYTVDQILDSVDETIGDYAIRILDIIDAKIAKNSEKWRNFDTSNISGELQRLGIDTSNIEDIESWIDNLENCE